MSHYRTLRLILGDQLNAKHSWFRQRDDRVLYLLAELPQELNYVKHHGQKIAAFFLAMQGFAEALAKAGHQVLHLTLDESAKYSDLPALLQALCKQHAIETFEFQRPDEYRLLQQLRQLKLGKSITIHEVDSEHFLLPFEEINKEFEPGKHRTMEHFYRMMRQRFRILMDGDKPAGGRWNFDEENRSALDDEGRRQTPKPLVFDNDASAIIDRLKKHKVDYFGKVEDRLLWPTSRQQSLKLLKHFCQQALPWFGRYQDAMTDQHEHAWSLFHSRLSFALNSKMLSVNEVIDAALSAHQQNSKQITLPQIEGFVRQIIGWREYMRGVYWANMPDYRQKNRLRAKRALPGYFWTADTKMNCLKQAIGQSLEYAYAHHIQRLMITGNFCLLTGIEPDEVDDWYLGIYIDAIEWVELPNTRGMSQFADGGLIATKPYASSGSYINKMSDYCKSCHYAVSKKTGERACPFNSLYWHFMNRHRNRFRDNPRIGMIYGSWDKMNDDKREAILQQADHYLQDLERL